LCCRLQGKAGHADGTDAYVPPGGVFHGGHGTAIAFTAERKRSAERRSDSRGGYQCERCSVGLFSLEELDRLVVLAESSVEDGQVGLHSIHPAIHAVEPAFQLVDAALIQEDAKKDHERRNTYRKQ
jgi:hypothetical protein